MPVRHHQTIHELYINYHGELETVLFARVHCRETAADICQEAFERLCRIDDLRGVSNLKAYLYRIALNLLTDHYRRRSVRETCIVEWPDEIPPEAKDQRCAETVAVGAQDLDKLIHALQDLSPLCRRIFYLNRFEGMKQRDIAETLNISLRTVEHNIKRALLHCTTTLNQA